MAPTKKVRGNNQHPAAAILPIPSFAPESRYDGQDGVLSEADFTSRQAQDRMYEWYCFRCSFGERLLHSLRKCKGINSFCFTIGCGRQVAFNLFHFLNCEPSQWADWLSKYYCDIIFFKWFLLAVASTFSFIRSQSGAQEDSIAFCRRFIFAKRAGP